MGVERTTQHVPNIVELGGTGQVSSLVGSRPTGSDVAAIGPKGRGKISGPGCQRFPGVVDDSRRLTNVPALGLLMGRVGPQKKIVAPKMR